QDTVAVGDEPNGFGEYPDCFLARFMLAAAVCRLDEDVLGVGHDGRVADYRRSRSTEVAGEHDADLGSALAVGYAEPDDRRAENVARVDERRVDPRRDIDLLAIVDAPKRSERRPRIRFVVQRRVEI